MTNYNKELQTMTIEKMAKCKEALYCCDNCPIITFCDNLGKSRNDCCDAWKIWLNSEVKDDETNC